MTQPFLISLYQLAVNLQPVHARYKQFWVNLEGILAVKLYFVDKLVLALHDLILPHELVRLLHLFKLAPLFLSEALVIHSQVIFDHSIVLPLAPVHCSLLR